MMGDKDATGSNLALSAQDYILNAVPFSMGVNGVGEGSDLSPHDGKPDPNQGSCMAKGGNCW